MPTIQIFFFQINHLKKPWLGTDRSQINHLKNHDLQEQTVSRSIQIKQKLPSSDLKIKKFKKKNNFRVSGKQIVPVKQTRYLCIYLNQHWTWNFRISQYKNKSSRTSGLLAKLKYYVKPDLLQTVYFAIFDSKIWNSRLGTK